MDIGDIRDRKYDVGNCSIFIADPAWDGTSKLFAAGGPLVWLGAKSGRIEFAANPEYSELKLPEQLGPAALKRYLTGTRPTAKFSLYADLEVMKAISPTGVASLGFERQILAKPLTVWCVPEELFIKQGTSGFPEKVSVVLNAGNWEKDGSALTTEEERLLHLSQLIWKADFTPLMAPFQHEDGGVALADVEIVAQTDLDRPVGCNQILYLGEAFGDYPAFPTSVLDFEPV